MIIFHVGFQLFDNFSLSVILSTVWLSTAAQRLGILPQLLLQEAPLSPPFPSPWAVPPLPPQPLPPPPSVPQSKPFPLP